MAISVGESLPDAALSRIGPEGPESVSLKEKTAGRKVALFAVPGAFTPTCTNLHMPGFASESDSLAKEGVDEIICIAVNDPFVLDAWDKATGASESGVTVLGDADGTFTRSIGMEFSAPAAGLHGRSSRYSMLVEDGRVSILNVEGAPGVCEVSSAASLLTRMRSA